MGSDEYPFANTGAARMLRTGLERAQSEHGLSQRDVARELGYKAAVVISHMASGRVPIPFERISEIASALKLEPGQFAEAVLSQRHPELVKAILESRHRMNEAQDAPGGIVHDLEEIAGCGLDDLPQSTRVLLMEVVADRSPSRRWLSVGELALVQAVRAIWPEAASRPIAKAELALIQNALQAVRAEIETTKPG